jgi:hypothetical protein
LRPSCPRLNGGDDCGLAHSSLIILAGTLWCLFAVVVFASASCLGQSASQSPLGRAKRSTRRVLFLIAVLISPKFYKKGYSLPNLAFKCFSLFPPSTPQKTKAKFSPAPENFAQKLSAIIREKITVLNGSMPKNVTLLRIMVGKSSYMPN